MIVPPTGVDTISVADPDENDIFKQTNPSLGKKKIYRKILPAAPTSKVSIVNIFRDTPYREQMQLSPHEMPLGGHVLFEAAKQRYQSQTTSSLIQNQQKHQDNRLTSALLRRKKPIVDDSKAQRISHEQEAQIIIPKINTFLTSGGFGATGQHTTEEVYKIKQLNRSKRTNIKHGTTSSLKTQQNQTQVNKVRRNASAYNSKVYEKGLNEHMSKIALQSYADFHQPLQVKYGDRYFQYLLRERHKQQNQYKPYLHQISRQRQKTKFLKSIEKNTKTGKPLVDLIQKKEFLQLKGTSKKIKQYSSASNVLTLSQLEKKMMSTIK